VLSALCNRVSQGLQQPQDSLGNGLRVLSVPLLQQSTLHQVIGYRVLNLDPGQEQPARSPAFSEALQGSLQDMLIFA
jgi:hypothetical protein